ncbi:hypothetical protein ACFQI7_20305 [Paenibacillus allorhizosphaerae]|uniref:Uncharacterized protein n=2 Tax=Paenibacillus allorhizosphaerae TaxID=2849866 RepID=A0ABN7TMP2_9BACL|nr:hypothetical protein PAECIP111802_03998 [Paenibacillus allorhizosphaerae]
MEENGEGMTIGIGKMRTLFAFSTISVCLMIAAWYMDADRKITVRESGSTAWVIPYAHAEDLIHEPAVHLIVKATVTSHTLPRIYEADARIGIVRRVMFTDIHVDQVLKSDAKIAAPTTITIVEPTYIEDNGFKPGKTEYPSGSYRKAEAGLKYIFFLAWSDKLQSYEVYARHQGKFNLGGTDLRERELEAMLENYRSLKAEVLQSFR